MRSWRIVAFLLLCLVLVGSMACNPFASSNQEELSQQLVEVVRGDLTVSVSCAGNIAIANEENLTFESSSGRVDKIYVRVGDKVSKGDVLAELAPLDTDALELALTQAQGAVTQQQLAIIQAQVALDQAEYDLDKAQDLYKWPEIKIAQADVDEADAYLEYALDKSEEAPLAEQASWERVITRASASLEAAQARLDAMLSGYDTEEVAIKKLQVEAVKLSLVRAQQSLEQAQQSLEQARKKLDNETLTAPWDGVVASVGAEVGDTFYSSAAAGTVIVRLIDLTALELPVQVDEIDIPKIKLNQRAVVSIDALPGVKLEGSVTAISPVPAAQSGVVLYDVTIGLTVPEGTDLKIGMSATADINIEKRSNVLLVPTQAIKQDRRGNSIVIVQAGEELQPRLVVTGLSVGLQTEILNGLSEGETVVVEMGAEAQPSPEPSGRQPVIPVHPGMGPPMP